MTDKIAEIRKRYAFAEENKSALRPAGFSWTIPGWQAHNDRSYLLAEVDRRGAENERMQAEIHRHCRHIELLYDLLAAAKHDDLSVAADAADEIERLREAFELWRNER